MSRIFDALRKADSRSSESHPAPAPPRPAHPSAPGSVTPMPAPPAHTVHAGVIHAAAIALPGDQVTREMTTLRVNLETTLVERATRVVGFVSAQGGEGTSTVAAQFALTLLADARTRVLFVDAHAARPVLELGSGSGPLAGLFADANDPRATGRLDLLPLPQAVAAAGLYPPADLEATLDALGGRYDWVVVDLAPVLYASESSSLAAVVDGVVVVIEAGRTKKPVLTRGVDLLRKAGARVLGSVLNRRQLEIPEFIYRRI
ncbi:MAG TPA: hypothetical protein VL123_00200 [Candidatus Udaeobacter sp.]|jgi:Mrp family chromosome partitioning ATPase|nr:hypothetical protein [Candidatus Udaeobacter sp.]